MIIMQWFFFQTRYIFMFKTLFFSLKPKLSNIIIIIYLNNSIEKTKSREIVF